LQITYRARTDLLLHVIKFEQLQISIGEFQMYLIFAEFTTYSTVDSNYKFLIHKFSFYTLTFQLHPPDLHFASRIKENWITYLNLTL